jgi:hypothetical protein
MAQKIQMRTCLFLGYNLTNELQSLTEAQASTIRNWSSDNELELAFDHYSGDFLFAGKEIIGVDSEEEFYGLIPAADEIANEIGAVKELFMKSFPQWSSYGEGNPQLYFLNYVMEVIQ